MAVLRLWLFMNIMGMSSDLKILKVHGTIPYLSRESLRIGQRLHRISMQMMYCMWFCNIFRGSRGAMFLLMQAVQ